MVLNINNTTKYSSSKMMGPQYLCCLYLATAGQQGPNLGSDEEEIVLLIYAIIEVSQNKIIGIRQYLVKPSVADVNENVLSEQIVTSSVITDELIKTAGQSLENVINDFDSYVKSLNIDPAYTQSFRLVTDGQLPIRQCLHPESCSKNMELPIYYNVFHDLRKEVHKFIHTSDNKLLNINGNNNAKIILTQQPIVIPQQNGGVPIENGGVNHTNSTTNQSSTALQIPQSIRDMTTCLDMKMDVENDFYIKEAKDMMNIIQRLISDGHRFECPETVNIILEPGICSKDDEIDGNCVVRARGLPWQSSDQDIAKFFRGLNVAKGGVALCLSPQGRRNGEALVRFSSQEHRDMALKRHKHHIGSRYIEVYRANGEDFLAVAGGSSNEAQAFLSRGAAVIVRMRGLPYDCTAKQVLDFFASGENSCQVLDGADGVLFVKKPDGRATGDAFVLFANESDAPKALSKHRELIGTRYIELFRSTTAEVQQVLNRSMDPKTYEQQQPLIAQMPQVPLLPQHIITSGTRKDCIRLRGLPYEAQVEHILEFLGEHAKNIVFQGVHMVYNAQGQPSGEAFIQMDSEKSAYLAAHQKHHRYMVFGKKQRYIEVFQCSGEDMSLVLTGGIPAPVSPAKGATALLSPGGTILPAGATYHPGPAATVTHAPNFTPAYCPPGGALGPLQCPPPSPAAALAAAARHQATFFPPPPIFYWPYPSPPVSPTSYYAPAMAPPPPHGHGLQAQPTHQQALIPADCIALPQLHQSIAPDGTLGPPQRIPAELQHEKNSRGAPVTPINGFPPPPPPSYCEIFLA